MKTRISSSLTAIAVAAALPVLVCAQDAPKPEKHSDPFAAKLAATSADEREAAFLGLMTQHHRGGVKMGELVPDRAKSEKLKEMMRKSEAEQKKEIGQMTEWLQQWHKKAPEDFKKPEKAEQQMEKDMAELRDLKGEAFDKAFAKKMAHHHLGAIEMSQLVVDQARHDEVKNLAKKIIETQRKERKELLDLVERKGAE